MTTIALKPGACLTIDDLETIESDGRRYELYDGTLVVTPSPAIAHQLVVTALVRALGAAAPSGLSVLVGPVDWLVTRSTVFVPDLLVVARRELTRNPQRLEVPPLLAIEVLSPSTHAFDLGAKRLAYAEAGLAHYWIVDAAEPSITLLRLDAAKGEYLEVGRAVGDEAVSAETPFALTIVPAALLDG